MSFSNNIELYDPAWRGILEQFGNAPLDRPPPPVLYGPFKDQKRATHERFKFYHYKGLVAKSPTASTAMIQGMHRLKVTFESRTDGRVMLKFESRHEGVQVIGLENPVPSHAIPSEFENFEKMMQEAVAAQSTNPVADRAIDKFLTRVKK